MALSSRIRNTVGAYMPQGWFASPHHFNEPQFQYQPVQDNHVRILTIQPGPRPAPIRCSFRTVALAASGGDDIGGGFTALSYCWGPRKEPKTIIVDSGQLHIQPTAYDLLVAVRNDTEPRDVWIDSVCIDQRNDAEKGAQVMLMGQIYTSAARVLVWLGGGTPDSDYAMESIHRYSAGDFTTARFARGMLGILDRPWFQRTWIIQEFVLNRNAPLISCGFAPPVCWDCLMGSYREAFPFSQGSEGVKPGQMPASVRALDLDKWRVYQRTLTMLNSLRRGIQKHAPDPAHYDLAYLLYATRPFLATDARDKIYGVLAMAHKDTRAHPLIRPDYTKSVEQVFRDATVYLLKEAQATPEWSETLRLPDGTAPERSQTEEAQSTAFYSVIALRRQAVAGNNSPMENHAPGRPSWVPDFSASHDGFPGLPWLYGNGQLTDFPSHRREDVNLTPDGRGLMVRGLILDRVQDVVQGPFAPTNDQSLPIHAYPQIAFLALFSLPFYLVTLGRALPPWNAPQIRRYRAMLLEEAETLLGVMALADRTRPATATEPGPLWKTLLLSLANNAEFQDDEQCQAMFSAHLAMSKDFVDTQRPNAWWIARPRLVAYLNHISSNSMAKNIRLAFCAGRSFFTGRSGTYYGIGEGDIRPGDVVALLFPDANRPFILRRGAREHYEMVGCAYIPESARVQAVEEANAAGLFSSITIL
ncbi:heterokaryon incompatibility protein-domain-containing protein [Apodospora peruviana]|uniref:Heterokaryon incompatibility protein-domain-containing protein n=1 Tax=Apodospora peruviana TaxID=516989 RepID=A0AAE0HU23_9PEZI|nr:heterokaryon incompatibility protein-domain-containing protein [Apodospora peruviana]